MSEIGPDSQNCERTTNPWVCSWDANIFPLSWLPPATTEKNKRNDSVVQCSLLAESILIKVELPMTFVSLISIVYPAILAINLPGRIEILGEVHLQVRYKPSVT
jgi:hypothetical protein